MVERFQFVATHEIDSYIRRSTPPNTQRNNIFATRVYDEWVAARNKSFPEDLYPELPVLPNLSVERIGKILSHFVFEIRRKDGNEYPADTVYGIMCAIMRFFRDDCLRPDLNFLDKTKDGFQYLRKSLDCRLKQLRAKGIGLHKKQASPIEVSDEDRLWSTQAFSIHTSEGLLSATYFYITKIFGLKSREHHRALSINHFQFDEDDDGKFVKYTGNISRTSLTGKQPSPKDLKLYDSCSSLSSYKILKYYIAALHQCNIYDGPFYRRPLATDVNKPRFSTIPLGVNSITALIPKAAKKAGLKGHFTGRSGRVSCNYTGSLHDVLEFIPVDSGFHSPPASSEEADSPPSRRRRIERTESSKKRLWKPYKE